MVTQLPSASITETWVVSGRGAPALKPRHPRLLAGADLLREPGRVRLAGEALHRHVDEPRIAHVAVLVDGRALHRLRHDAEILGRVVLEPTEGEVLQDVQHLEQHHARRPAAGWSRRGSRGRCPRAARCGRCASPRGRRPPSSAVVPPHVLDDGVGDLALVEDLVAVLGDEAQRLAEVAVDHAIAHPLGRAVGPAVERAGGRREGQALVVRGAGPSARRPPTSSATCGRTVQPPSAQRDRRLHDLLPRQPAVLPVRVAVGPQARRHADRLVADVVDPAAQDEAVAVARLGLDQVGPHLGADARAARGRGSRCSRGTRWPASRCRSCRSRRCRTSADRPRPAPARRPSRRRPRCRPLSGCRRRPRSASGCAATIIAPLRYRIRVLSGLGRCGVSRPSTRSSPPRRRRA